MNDFLRACNCEHPREEDCEKCIGEAAPKTAGPGASAPATPATPDKKPLPAAADKESKGH